jgi:hypothetical protein
MSSGYDYIDIPYGDEIASKAAEISPNFLSQSAPIFKHENFLNFSALDNNTLNNNEDFIATICPTALNSTNNSHVVDDTAQWLNYGKLEDNSMQSSAISMIYDEQSYHRSNPFKLSAFKSDQRGDFMQNLNHNEENSSVQSNFDASTASTEPNSTNSSFSGPLNQARSIFQQPSNKSSVSSLSDETQSYSYSNPSSSSSPIPHLSSHHFNLPHVQIATVSLDNNHRDPVSSPSTVFQSLSLNSPRVPSLHSSAAASLPPNEADLSIRSPKSGKARKISNIRKSRKTSTKQAMDDTLTASSLITAGVLAAPGAAASSAVAVASNRNYFSHNHSNPQSNRSSFSSPVQYGQSLASSPTVTSNNVFVAQAIEVNSPNLPPLPTYSNGLSNQNNNSFNSNFPHNYNNTSLTNNNNNINNNSQPVVSANVVMGTAIATKLPNPDHFSSYNTGSAPTSLPQQRRRKYSAKKNSKAAPKNSFTTNQSAAVNDHNSFIPSSTMQVNHLPAISASLPMPRRTISAPSSNY